MKKFERLLALIYLLKGRHRMRAAEIARHLGITERTVYRDIAALNEAFGDYVQVICTHEGYSLDTKIYAPPLRLVADELEALQTAVAAMQEQNPHFQLAHQALSKLESQSGTFLDLTDLENRLAVMQPSAKDRVPLKRLQELERALQSKCMLAIEYFSHHSGEVRQWTFEPYSLLFRKMAWYLLGREVEGDRVLLLRAYRIRDIRVLPQAAGIPADFSVKDYFREHWEVFDGTPEDIHLHFSGQAALLIEEMQWHPSQSMKANPDGTLDLYLKVPAHAEFISWVLGWGADCQVIEPLSLRRKVEIQMQRLQQAYTQSAQTSHHKVLSLT